MRVHAWGLLAGVWGACAFAQGLEGLVERADLWALSQSGVVEALPQVAFRQQEAGRLISSTMPGLSLFGFGVCEARCFLTDGLLSRMEVSFYNKGDSRQAPQALFEELVRGLQAELEKRLGQPAGAPERVSSGAVQGKFFRYRCTWRRAPMGYSLEWAYTLSQGDGRSFVAEYINLVLVPLQKDGGAGGGGAGGVPEWKSTVSLASLKKNVQRNTAGDVWIEGVPMIDQGQKGYCAVAAVERIFRYYGRTQVDQHTVAQLAETGAGGGTQFNKVIDAVAVIGKRYDYDVWSGCLLLKQGDGWERTEFYQCLEDYNRLARAQNAPQVRAEDYTFNNRINLSAILDAYDPARFKAVRTRKSGQMALFAKNLAASIDRGVPVLWSCVVGKFPESPPLTIDGGGAFAHVRLIIGYNSRTREVLYTDTWGIGHELKRLSLETAWTITQGLCTLTPRH